MAAREKKNRLQEVLARSFDVIFPPDGYDLHNYTVNNNVRIRKYSRIRTRPDNQLREIVGEIQSDHQQYIDHPLTRLTSFLGLPNRALDSKPQSIKNILKNLIGWQSKTTLGIKTVNGLLMPFTLVFNIIKFPFKFAINITKLGTEFLPKILEKGFEVLSYKFTDAIPFQIKNQSNFKKAIDGLLTVGLGLGFIVSTILQLICKSVYLLGRSITSPMVHYRRAWEYSKTLYSADNPIGKVISGCFVVISSIPSCAFYAMVFPIALPYLAAGLGYIASHALPFLATHLPNLILAAANSLYKIFQSAKPVVEAIAAVMNEVIGSFLFTNVFFPYANSVHAGLGMLFNVALLTVGNSVNYFANKIENWWRGKYYKKPRDMIQLNNCDDDPDEEIELKKFPIKIKRLSTTAATLLHMQDEDNNKKEKMQIPEKNMCMELDIPNDSNSSDEKLKYAQQDNSSSDDDDFKSYEKELVQRLPTKMMLKI